MVFVVRRFIYLPDTEDREQVPRRVTIWTIVVVWLASGVGILAGIGSESALR